MATGPTSVTNVETRAMFRETAEDTPTLQLLGICREEKDIETREDMTPEVLLTTGIGKLL